MPKKLSEITDVRAAVMRAQNLITEAIAELDEAKAPADIAAHLDTALHCMLRFLTEGGINRSGENGPKKVCRQRVPMQGDVAVSIVEKSACTTRKAAS